MPLHYQKPPLVEALCEVRFVSADDKWDWAIPGMLYEKIKDRFPKRRERHALDISIPINIPIPLGPATHSIERLQFVSADENTIVQIGPELLAVNSLRPHLGWPDLRDTLLQVLAAYRSIAAPAGVAMAAVRYINRVELPLRQGFALERYFAVLPALPEGVQQTVSTFLVHTEVGYEDPPALFRFRFGTTESKSDAAAFMLDYEHLVHGDDAPSFEALPAWLDAGHERIERAFYGSFTSGTHAEIFQEIRS
jgi:uncharacterized protein (TIGR04255 family)